MEGYCTLNTDASVKGDVGGYAIWIVSDAGRLRRYGRFHTPVSDANLAEMMAVINGLHLVLSLGLPVQTMVVNTDNATCRSVINKQGAYRSQNRALQEMADLLWSMCQGFPTIYAKHLKGHTRNTSARHVVNRWCDEYTRRGRLGL